MRRGEAVQGSDDHKYHSVQLPPLCRLLGIVLETLPQHAAASNATTDLIGP